MKKYLKVAALSALSLSLLAGCGKKSTGESSEEAKYAKAGLGVVSNYSDGQVNSTFVALGLDKDGKIQYIDLDVAQSSPGAAEGEYTQTKEERGDDYNMKKASPIGKEWDEQAEAFEKWCTGKTVDEVVSADTAGDKDLTAGCTIKVEDFVAAVEKAGKNAVEVSAASIKLGRYMVNGEDYAGNPQLDTTLTMYALDAEDKVVLAQVDVAQIHEGVTDTKKELGTDYNMKETSPIGKEWDEQAAAYEKWCVGKTLADITKEESASDADLTAGCTISINDFVEATKKAK